MDTSRRARTQPPSKRSSVLDVEGLWTQGTRMRHESPEGRSGTTCYDSGDYHRTQRVLAHRLPASFVMVFPDFTPTLPGRICCWIDTRGARLASSRSESSPGG